MNQDFNLIKLDDYTKQEKEELIKRRIELRKGLSRFNACVRNASKDEKCAICKKNMSSFCNSHSIPAMCLRRIADSGDVCPSTGLLDNPILNNRIGVNQSGTFAMICKECDQYYFIEYEDPTALITEPTQKIMCEIALKNYLNAEYTSRNTMNAYTQLMQQHPNFDMREALFVEKLAIEAYRYEQRNILRMLNKIKEDKIHTDVFSLLCFDVIDYITPVAFQNRVALFCDFDGKMINDIYYLSSKYKMQDLHICIFPLANATAIIVFNKYEDTRYRSFRAQFKKLQKTEKLSAINYIILCYNEEYYYSPTIHPLISSDKSLIKAIKKAPNPEGINTADCDPKLLHQLASETYDLSEHKITTNLLDPKYQL